MRLLRNLAGFSRLIMYDKRGVGLSDPVPGTPTLEEHTGDVRAVLDAVGSERAVLFGLYEAAAIFALCAATHPERTRALVLYGAFPAAPDVATYPGSAEMAEFGEGLKAAVDTWGRGATLAVLAPDLGKNRVMRRLWATFERASMSPAVARAQLDWTSRLDVRAALPAVHVPTLVLHCTGDVVPIATGRYAAECIPGARFTELPGDWHAPLTGDMDLLTDAVEEFVESLPPDHPPERALATALVLAAAGDGAISGAEPMRSRVSVAGGVVIDHKGGRLTARFDGPARAVRCALGILDDARAHGHEMCAGVHTGECEIGADGLRGAPLSIAAELAERALPGEVLTTGTVRDLVIGSGIEFGPRGVPRLASTPGESPIFAATGTMSAETIPAAATEPIPLFDRAAHGLARHAPAVSRSTLRLIKGGK